MTHQPDDRDLAERFAQLRREELEAAPTFSRVTVGRARERSRRVPIAIGLATAVVAATIIGVLVVRNGTRREAAVPLDLGATRWTAPTDFLLDVPGNWLLRDLPRIAAPASMQFDTASYRRISS